MRRFFRRGVSEVFFLTAVADPSAPTAAEITAGVDLSEPLADIGGFMLNNSPIETPSLKTTFDSQIEGVDKTADSTLTFDDDDTNEVVRTALAKGEVGFIVLCPYGNATGKRAEVWPVKSTGFNDQWNLNAESAKAVASFAVTGLPTQDGVLTA